MTRQPDDDDELMMMMMVMMMMMTRRRRRNLHFIYLFCIYLDWSLLVHL